jgi:hypothetical protein
VASSFTDVSEPHGHVLLLDGKVHDGRPSKEYLAAFRVSENRFRLLDSPWRFFGCASGDVVEVAPDGEWKLVERGGRISVQFWVSEDDVHLARTVEPLLAAAGATLDNVSPKGQAFVYSFLESVGHRFVMATIAKLHATYAGITWCYGNVYPENSDEPFEWARELLTR